MLSLDLCCFCGEQWYRELKRKPASKWGQCSGISELSGGDRARGEGDVPKLSAAVVIIHTYPADSTPRQGYLSRPCHREKARSANVLHNYHMPQVLRMRFSCQSFGFNCCLKPAVTYLFMLKCLKCAVFFLHLRVWFRDDDKEVICLCKMQGRPMLRLLQKPCQWICGRDEVLHLYWEDISGVTLGLSQKTLGCLLNWIAWCYSTHSTQHVL